MTVLDQLRQLYFNVTRASIGDDFATAIDLFKQLSTEEERDKAAVFMDGIAEMRREWKDASADGRTGAKARKGTTRRTRGPRAPGTGSGGRRKPE